MPLDVVIEICRSEEDASTDPDFRDLSPLADPEERWSRDATEDCSRCALVQK
jgi:hypothetical protein